jgi:phospho-N-acetylmuramoyl-pentapeptide-transferase
MEKTVLFISVLALTFICTVLILRKLIPFLKSKKMGQHILEIGPRWHKNKEGTPTMGGLSFIIASAIAVCGATVYISVRHSFSEAVPLLITYGYAIVSGLIGMIDDSAKLRKAQNEGLTAPQKYLLQLLAAGAFLAAMMLTGNLTTKLAIPFASGLEVELGIFYYVIALLLLTGVNNAVNLTDGIDGLCSSVTLVVGVFFALGAFVLERGGVSLTVSSALVIGAAAGFLVYNFYPARVFMGDTGSLFFGAMITGMAFVVGSPLIIVIAGIIYITETVSVILQVGYFKLTHGKRLFKMSPIHHHFEKSGWSELKIVGVFTVVTAFACALAWLGLVL